MTPASLLEPLKKWGHGNVRRELFFLPIWCSTSFSKGSNILVHIVVVREKPLHIMRRTILSSVISTPIENVWRKNNYE